MGERRWTVVRPSLPGQCGTIVVCKQEFTARWCGRRSSLPVPSWWTPCDVWHATGCGLLSGAARFWHMEENRPDGRSIVVWRLVSRPLATVVALVAVVVLYAQVIAVHSPSTQAPTVAIVIDGLNPPNNAGLRVDVLLRVTSRTLVCGRTTTVKAVISGTPVFWRKYGNALRGVHRIGIALPTNEDARLQDWSGYNLPGSLSNLERYPRGRIQNPRSSGKVNIKAGQDSKTGGLWYTAEIRDWGTHRTPLVFEVEGRWTTRRGLGSCYVMLPELVADRDIQLDDAYAAAVGASSVLDLESTSPVPNAVTFGRVILRTNGHIVDAEARPSPGLVDANPWVRGLGQVGEEAAVWACEPPARRDVLPSQSETTPDVGSVLYVGCGGLAVVEARNVGTVRDLCLLLIGGLFGFIFDRLIKMIRVAMGRLQRARVKVDKSLSSQEQRRSSVGLKPKRRHED